MEKHRNWSWDNLRYFLGVARHGTLSEAARQLDVSHSTVQRRISALEHELQTCLFSRTGNGYKLTQSGEALFRESLHLQTTLENISRKVADSDSVVRGRVVLTSTDTLCFCILPALIQSLTRTYPGLCLELNMLNRMSDVENLEADIAIRSCREPPTNLIGRRIGSVRFSLCAARSYCLDHDMQGLPDTIDEHHVIVLGEEYASTPFHRWLSNRLSDNTQKTITSGFLSAFSLCRAGLGVTILPSFLVEEASDLVVLDHDDLPVSNDLWILSHSDLRSTARVRVVRQYLYEELSRLFA